VLKMTLRPTSYDWEFIPIPGQTFTDSGSAPCVSAPSVPTPPPALPTTGEVTSTTAASTAGVSTVAAEEAQPTLAVESASPAGSRSDYTVAAGDTLSGIAARYGLDWTVLAAANNIAEDDFLQIGQVLRIPGAMDSAAGVQPAAARQETAAATAAGTAAATADLAAPLPAPSATAGAQVHVVVAGDTIFAIALANGVDWQTLLRLNGLEEDAILQIGQRVQLP
jgi:LysM repeat protein